jgi:hypothetical protein
MHAGEGAGTAVQQSGGGVEAGGVIPQTIWVPDASDGLDAELTLSVTDDHLSPVGEPSASTSTVRLRVSSPG